MEILTVGQAYMWRGKPVLVIDGFYMGAHGLSNFWYWRCINPDGSLGRRYSGYDNKGEFTPIKNFEIRIILPE